MVRPVETDVGLWSVSGHPLAIEYSLSVLQEIRTLVVDGFNRVPHGGVEVGGVLFGEHVAENGDVVRILNFRPLACEHASGPSFVLSEADRAALEELLQSVHSDESLRGLEPVGWYHSHTRSGIFLSRDDLEIWKRYFPEPWQIAMVLRPAKSDPTRVGFFFRELDGSVRAEASYKEFTIGPVRSAPVLSSPPPSDVSGPRNGLHPPSDPPQIDSAVEAGEIHAGSDNPEPVPRPAFVPDHPLEASHRSRWLIPAICLAIIGAGLAFAIYLLRGPSHQLSLRAADSDGQLRIEWDRTAKPILEAEGASLQIAEGSAKVQIELDPESLRKGSVSYTRQSEDLEVRLKVRLPQGAYVEELTRFLGHPDRKRVPEQPAAVRQEQLEREAEAVREKLRQQAAETARLEQELSILRKRQLLRPADGEPAPPPQSRTEVSRLTATPLKPDKNAPLTSSSSPSTQARVQGPPANSAISVPQQVDNGMTAVAVAPVDPQPRIAARSSDGTEKPVNVLPPDPLPVSAPSVPPARKETGDTLKLPEPAPPAHTPVSSPPVYSGPVSGKAIWTGRFPKSGPLTLEGNHASAGYLNGALPGVPVRIAVYPGRLTAEGITLYSSNPNYARKVVEPPGAQNGWNKTVYSFEPKLAKDIAVVETPNPQNRWNRLVLRSTNFNLSLIILEWHVIQH